MLGKGLKKYYIDGFGGAGVHVAKRTREQVEGSPAHRSMGILRGNPTVRIDSRPRR
jgi:hypothetical protein